MPNFTDYEKQHLHDYVVKKGQLDAVKAQIDTEKATKKTSYNHYNQRYYHKYNKLWLSLKLNKLRKL